METKTEMTKYLVIDEKKDGDVFEYIYDRFDDANAAAKRGWDHLSNFDKKRSHIYVAKVRESDLDDDAFDDDGAVDWRCFVSCAPCGFDSDTSRVEDY